MPNRSIVLACCVLCACGAARAAVLHLTTENSPPATLVAKGQVSGRVVDKVTTMVKRAGLDYDIEVLPWQRAYHAAVANPQTCVFPATRTEDREAQFNWVGPLAAIDWVLYGMAGRQFKLQSLDDARPYLIGTYLGDARDAYLRERGLRVAPVADDRNNAGKLLAGRIDLWAGSKALALMQQSELDARIVPVLVFHKVELYLACHRSVAPDTIQQLNATLAEMQRDGTIKAIERRYARWQRP